MTNATVHEGIVILFFCPFCFLIYCIFLQFYIFTLQTLLYSLQTRIRSKRLTLGMDQTHGFLLHKLSLVYKVSLMAYHTHLIQSDNILCLSEIVFDTANEAQANIHSTY